MNLHEAKSVDHQAAARVIAGVVYSKVGPGRTEGDVPIHLVKLAGDRKHEFWAQKVADQRESSYFRVSLGWWNTIIWPDTWRLQTRGRGVAFAKIFCEILDLRWTLFREI